MKSHKAKDTLRKGLSKREARLLSALSAIGKRIITVKDIESTLACSYDNARRIAADLIGKRWLENIAKGKYLIIPLEAGEEGLYTEHEFLIASELVTPYYIGFWSALNFHGLTEQTPFTVFVVTTERKPSMEIHKLNYKFITLVQRKFFGFRPYALGDKRIHISNPEKTIIDALSLPGYSGGGEEVAQSLRIARERISLERLIRYGLKMNDGAVLKRLRYLLDLTAYEVPNLLKSQMEKSLTTGYPLLDPSMPDRGKYSRKWLLKLNIAPEKSQGEAP